MTLRSEDFLCSRDAEVAVASSNQSTPTRKKLAFGGKQYRRTSKGNLVTAAARCVHLTFNCRRTFRIFTYAHSADASKKPCRYYTKTGVSERKLATNCTDSFLSPIVVALVLL